MRRPLLAVFLALSVVPAVAADPVRIVIGPEAAPLEKLAAEEIAETLKHLFSVDSEILTVLKKSDSGVILVGRPETNAFIHASLGERWPKLSDQGHYLKSVKVSGHPMLVVGGGSPVATFWAASELAHRWGVRSLLYGNALPAEKPKLTIDDFDAVIEPVFRQRAWTLMDDTPVGPAAWGLADQKKLIRQLARLKFNRVVLEVRPWQPFVSWEYNLVKKTSADLWPGGSITVGGDTAGRGVFKGAPLFDNLDLVGKKTQEERIAAGIALMKGIIEESHRYGLTVALSVNPFEFPLEFEGQVPDAKPSPMEEDLAVIPGAEATLTNDAVLKIARAQLRAWIETYPTIDLLLLQAPYDWDGDAEAAWARLQQTGTISKVAQLNELLTGVKKRKGPLSGEEGMLSVAAQIAGIPPLRHLIEHPTLLERKGQGPIPVEVDQLDPALAKLGLRITPSGNGLLFAPEAGDKLSADVAADKLTLALDWSDVHLGVLPRFYSEETTKSLATLREGRWAGFTVHAPIVGGLDPTALFLSRASFDGTVTFEATLRDLVEHVSGEGIADRVVKAVSLIEKAAETGDLSDLPYAGADAMIFERHDEDHPSPENWAKIRDANLGAMDEMYRANTRAREGAREFTLYYARRFESAFEIMNSLEAMRQAKVAEGKEEKEKQVEQLEKAIESMYGGLNAYAAVARDPSDRGVIALLNRSAYRYLQRRLEESEK